MWPKNNILLYVETYGWMDGCGNNCHRTMKSTVLRVDLLAHAFLSWSDIYENTIISLLSEYNFFQTKLFLPKCWPVAVFEI